MNSLFASPTLVGLTLQSAGVLMIAVLCLTLLRTIRRAPLVPWTAAWIALFIALMLLLLSFRVPPLSVGLYPAYMFFEYLFGYLVFAGCREYTGGKPFGRSDLPFALSMLVPAVVLPVAARWQFNVFFAFHALIYAYLFLLAWRQLQRAPD